MRDKTGSYGLNKSNHYRLGMRVTVANKYLINELHSEDLAKFNERSNSLGCWDFFSEISATLCFYDQIHLRQWNRSKEQRMLSRFTAPEQCYQPTRN